ncbi:uncharacterized protein METZ01_LOCUS251304, partial [marine metagenome]
LRSLSDVYWNRMVCFRCGGLSQGPWSHHGRCQHDTVLYGAHSLSKRRVAERVAPVSLSEPHHLSDRAVEGHYSVESGARFREAIYLSCDRISVLMGWVAMVSSCQKRVCRCPL